VNQIYIDGENSSNTEMVSWLYHNISNTHIVIDDGIMGIGWKFIFVMHPTFHYIVTIDDKELATEFALRFL
jgi:hypothetical protein